MTKFEFNGNLMVLNYCFLIFIKMIQVHRKDFQIYSRLFGVFGPNSRTPAVRCSVDSGQEPRDNLGQMPGVNINGFTFVFGH